MVAVSSAVAKDECVKGDCCTRIEVVGDQVTVCVRFLTAAPSDSVEAALVPAAFIAETLNV